MRNRTRRAIATTTLLLALPLTTAACSPDDDGVLGDEESVEEVPDADEQ